MIEINLEDVDWPLFQFVCYVASLLHIDNAIKFIEWRVLE